MKRVYKDGEMIYTMTHKQDKKRWFNWWIKKNWQTVVVLILEWLIIGSLIAGCVLWLFE